RRQEEPQAPSVAPTAASNVSAKDGAVPAPERLRDAKLDRTGRPQRDRGGARPEGGPPRRKRGGRPEGDAEPPARGDRRGRAPPTHPPDRDPAVRAENIKGRGGERGRPEHPPKSPIARNPAATEQGQGGT